MKEILNKQPGKHIPYGIYLPDYYFFINAVIWAADNVSIFAIISARLFGGIFCNIFATTSMLPDIILLNMAAACFGSILAYASA